MDGAPTSVGFILSPELLRSRGFSMPGSLVSSLSLPAGACPTSSPSPELSGFLRCSPGPGISEPLRPPSLHPGSLASRPESTPLGAECHPDPRFAGQGSSGTRVTTFHELALRRRRSTVPAPRPPAPLPADSTSGPPPPPPVITFRELRWRGRVNGAGPREEAVEETPLPADWLPAVAGSSAGRGTADGGTKPAREVDRGSPPPRESGRKHPRMGEVTPMASIHPPSLEARGPTLKPPSKRGLVCAVSASVDNLIAHFSAARNVVQKTQLGNSRDSPRVGHMLLAGLCPALSAVLGNGLKVYRHDLVVGRRPNSPWTVVEASVKAGHTPRHLYNMFHQLDGLSQLSGSQRKFNAFVFALLNLKLLDFWMASLHNCTGALRTLYTPSAFLCLSHSELFEELLLLLQPLSTFSFQLDPLFEYHHSPQASEISRLGQMVLGTDQLDRTKWQGDKEPCASRADQAFPGSPAGVEEGYRVQETLDQVSWCAWRLGRAVLELGVGREAQGNPRPSEVGAGWWGQLARSCQVDLLLPNYPSRGLGVGPRQREVARAQGDATAGAQRDPMAGAQGHPTAGAQRDPTDGAGLMDSTWDIPHGTETPRLILASLFGARIPGTHSPRHPEHQKSSDPRGRLPSDWLRLNISNLWRAPPAKTARPPGTGEVKTQGGETRKSARTVQTLCDHQAVEDGHLDFRRGETLEVLGFFDDAWIRCRRGNASGLVPIEYTSLVWP